MNHIQKDFQILNHLKIDYYRNRLITGINYPSKLDDWKKFEKNNPTIALNILYTKEKEILPAYVSKHDSTFEK